jgi:FeS assembly SUF system protein
MSEGTDNLAAPPTTGGDAATEAVRERIVETLKTVYDPEIPVDIYEMGLIYRVEIKDVDDNAQYPVDVVMTLTSPMCPVAETLPPEVETKVRSVEGVGDVHLDLVWDPPWTPDMMSEVAKLALNM